MPPQAGSTWDEWFKWYLCEIYKAAGGDCKDLFGDNTQRVKTTIAYYEVHGAPKFPNDEAKKAYLELLVQFLGHLALPGNDLPPEVNMQLKELLENLLNGIGP